MRARTQVGAQRSDRKVAIAAQLLALLIVLANGTAAYAAPEAAPGAAPDGSDEMAEADDSGARKQREAGWSPAGSFSFGVITQSISGDTTSDVVDFPSRTGDSYISEYFQFEGKLYTPLQLEIPLKPRLYLTAGVQVPLASELIAERIDEELINRYEPGANNPQTNLLNRPDDSAFVQQEFLDNCLQNSPAPGTATNMFSRIESCALRIRNKVTVDATWQAGVGVEFSAPIMDTVLRLRPAVEYFGMSVQTSGEFARTNSGTTLDDIEELVTGVGDPEIYHGIAPSIAIAVDVLEDGPWRWSMFVQGRGIWFLNKPNLAAQAALSSTNNLVFSSSLDNVAWQVGGGFQVQWTGLR